MSLPIEHARGVAQSMRVGAVRNFIAQAKAKQVLREVHELPANFPQFTPDLDERVTFVAYALLAAGCSMVELGELADGYSEIHSSADLLESAHRTEAQNDRGSGFHCLIGAMAFYVCGHYSRAFVLVRNVETVTASAGVIASFLLDAFRGMVDRYLNPEPNAKPLDNLVKEFETWACENSRAFVEKMPEQDLLDKLRPLWLGGTSLHEIVSKCGEDSWQTCTEFYGFELPWLFHSVSQKLDKLTEEHRVEALGLTGLLVELGLANETAAKVFLAGVRSRAAAVELGGLLSNASASVRRIRDALLDPATVRVLSDSVSASTIAWLHLLSAEHGKAETEPPRCVDFRLHIESPEDISTLHARQASAQDPVYLCSTDAKFKCAVGSSDTLPFDKLANDPRYCFARDDDVWHLNCRDPRVPGAFL